MRYNYACDLDCQYLIDPLAYIDGLVQDCSNSMANAIWYTYLYNVCCSDDTRCWLITTDPSLFPLQIKIIYLDLEPHVNCIYDTLKMYDGSEYRIVFYLQKPFKFQLLTNPGHSTVINVPVGFLKPHGPCSPAGMVFDNIIRQTYILHQYWLDDIHINVKLIRC